MSRMLPGMLLAAIGNMPISALGATAGTFQPLRSFRHDDPPTIGPGKGMPPKQHRPNNFSYTCPGYKTHKCNRTISGNKNHCKSCADLKMADEKNLWQMVGQAMPGSQDFGTDKELSYGPWIPEEFAFECVRISRQRFPEYPCWAQRVFPDGRPRYYGHGNPDRLP